MGKTVEELAIDFGIFDLLIKYWSTDVKVKKILGRPRKCWTDQFDHWTAEKEEYEENLEINKLTVM